MPLTIGDRAPRFALPAEPGEIVDVGARMATRPVVLLFFPLAFSSVCTEELLHRAGQLERMGSSSKRRSSGSRSTAPSSPAGSARSWVFRSRCSRTSTTTSRAAYGVLYEDYFGLRGVARRAAFVVGRGWPDRLRLDQRAGRRATRFPSECGRPCGTSGSPVPNALVRVPAEIDPAAPLFLLCQASPLRGSQAPPRSVLPHHRERTPCRHDSFAEPESRASSSECSRSSRCRKPRMRSRG